MTGKVIHFELPADDLERAQRFYKNVFGWRLSSEPGHGYVLAKTTDTDAKGAPTEPGAINGGMLKRTAPIRAPVITISVASIDEASRKIEGAGGRIVRGRMPVGPIGFAAYFTDPEGNVVGLWEDAKAP